MAVLRASLTSTPPAVLTPSVYTLDSSGAVNSYTKTHTRTAGAGLQATIIYRHGSNPAPTVTGVTFNGQALTERGQDQIDGSGNIGCAVYTLDPGVGDDGGPFNLVWTLSSTDARDAVGWVTDITGTSGAQASGAAVASGSTSTSPTVNITPANANGLLVGAIGCIDATGTVTKGAAWTQIDNSQSAGDSVAIEGALQWLAPGSTGVQACDGTLSTAKLWAALVAGWNP